MRLIPGGLPKKGDEVVAGDGRLATIVRAGFSTHVFRDDASIRYKDGTLDLVPLNLLQPADGIPDGNTEGFANDAT